MKKAVMVCPMHGITQKVEAKFCKKYNLAKAFLTDKDFEVFDTFSLDLALNIKPEPVLKKEFSALRELFQQSSVVVFMNGWRRSSVCRTEHEIAKEEGKAILYENCMKCRHQCQQKQDTCFM